MHRTIILSSLPILAVACLAGCSGAGGQSARADLQAKSDSHVSGTVQFHETADGVEVSYQLSGLPGAGQYGFHIHESGDCSAADGSSAKGHWNPAGADHGGPEGPGHAGDLGNIEADQSGAANGSISSSRFHLGSEPSPIGLAVIVHGKADDLHSQPTGNAGPRIACGVIVAR
ncbi:MAG: superoxide dismutase family protein [Leptospirales bacterium]|nr:superoxide dismutase family protein [Leptospirales bacterium]